MEIPHDRAPSFLAVPTSKPGMLLTNPDGSCMLLTKSDEPSVATMLGDVNEMDAQMHTLLHHAAKRGDVDDTMRLLKMNAKVNVVDARGITPLHVAACQNHPRIVRMLCAAGADVDARHHSGAECIADRPLILRKSALHFAAERSHMEVIEILLEHGACPQIRSDNDRCPDLAAYYEWRRENRCNY